MDLLIWGFEMSEIIREIPYAILIAGIALIGLYLANIFLDYGSPQYISRKVAHAFGGMAFLLCALLFSSYIWPIILAAGFTFLLGGARLVKTSTFRGAGGSSRAHAFAEVFFPSAGALALLNWVWSGNAFLGVLPGLYLGFGDMVTGLTRNWHCKKEKKGWCGTIAMLLVCLLVSYLLRPYWIGAAMAVTATLAERFTPLTRGWIDDNWVLTLSSALVGGILYAYFG